MLKAVYLNNKAHKHLIKFINEFQNENGQQNISSAIRFLMQKGYESLQSKKIETLKEKPKNDIVNREEIKKEVMAEIMSEINSTLLVDLTDALKKLGNLQAIPINTIQTKPAHEEKIQQKVEKKIPTNIDSGSLLANILGNATR